MKILRVIASMNPAHGGPCQGIRNSIPVLNEQGICNEVVCMDDADDIFMGKDRFPVHAIGKSKGPWSYNHRLIPWLLQNFHRFDVIIIHGLWLYHSYAVRKALTEYKKQNKNENTLKVYVMPHGMLDPYFQKAKGRKLKAIRNWLYWKLIEGKIINNADGVLFTCMEELLLARKTFRPYFPKQELNVGYGIVRPPVYTNIQKTAFITKCPGIEDYSYLLFLSRIHEKKGVDVLVKTYLLLRKKNYALPKLVIAGPGLDTNYGQEMKKLAAETNDIFFPGMLTGNAKWGAFYGCEAFILPSHQENFGIAVVEAMACGKPVLISNKVNIWREIEANGGGIVNEDILEGILQLLTTWNNMNKEERERMGIAAMQIFANKFIVEKATSKFLEAISTKNNFKEAIQDNLL